MSLLNRCFNLNTIRTSLARQQSISSAVSQKWKNATHKHSVHYTSRQHKPVKMATATTIKLSLADAGVFSSGAREDSAKIASELLQEDMRVHHIFFNKSRFHSKAIYQ